jgi:hypothetical protein
MTVWSTLASKIERRCQKPNAVLVIRVGLVSLADHSMITIQQSRRSGDMDACVGSRFRRLAPPDSCRHAEFVRCHGTKIVPENTDCNRTWG